ncbi:MAG: sigma-70 family RNA polymerase sigma factor, partial [Planctomycetes bacterium]|nr:sigma-70 family RNA polymerase sigma factor [Planctomycetota bacterium]
MPDHSADRAMAAGGFSFGSTQWSVVAAAGHLSSPDCRAALADLCERYWYPLYAYVRRRVADAEEARDLTQAFFARLLEKNYLADADRSE